MQEFLSNIVLPDYKFIYQLGLIYKMNLCKTFIVESDDFGLR